MKAIIIDDESLARSIVREYLQHHPGITIVQECADGFEGLKAIQQHQPDLLFLDIQMPKITGFEMLELLEKPPAVIFTTAFEEYAIKAFESHAVDYLLKPFSKERFDKAMQKWEQQNRQERQEHTQSLLSSPELNAAHQGRIVLKDGGRIKIIPSAHIHYLEAADDYVKIHTAEGHFLKNRTMSFFEQQLDPQNFVRIHRSYLINIQLITRIEPYEKDSYLAVLSVGVKLPVSRSGYARLKQSLGI